MSVLAVVVAAWRPDAMDVRASVGGVPMVVRAVRSVLAAGVTEHVVVRSDPADVGWMQQACAGLPVTGWVTRGSPWRAVRHGAGDVFLLHDAARPLAPSTLVSAVVKAIGSGHDVVVPVLPLTDTVKQVDAGGIVRATPDRAGLRVAQTPVAIRRELLGDDPGADPIGLAVAHAASGGAVHTVEGHRAAFAVRTAWDLELAELLAGSVDPCG